VPLTDVQWVLGHAHLSPPSCTCRRCRRT
jgi:hypothetical protein